MVAFFGYFFDFCANIVFWGKMGLFGCFVFKFNKNNKKSMSSKRRTHNYYTTKIIKIG